MNEGRDTLYSLNQWGPDIDIIWFRTLRDIFYLFSRVHSLTQHDGAIGAISQSLESDIPVHGPHAGAAGGLRHPPVNHSQGEGIIVLLWFK